MPVTAIRGPRAVSAWVYQLVGTLITGPDGPRLVADPVIGTAGNLREPERIKYQRDYFTVLGFIGRQANIRDLKR
jgi:hypothetical protein